jgi:putative ABC transport system permease protein
MLMTKLQFYGALDLGLIYAIVSIGVYLTFRVIDFPDLTVDGSFPLGASVCAVLILDDYDPFVAIFMAFGAGALAGLVTGLLHVKGKIMELLAGILTMSALYSINLRILKSPNQTIHDHKTIFSNVEMGMKGSSSEELVTYVLLLVVVIFISTITYILDSEVGLAMRSSGINTKCSQAQGISVGRMKILGLVLSNASVAAAGAIFAQSLGYADITMGSGTIIVGLASVIIGEKLLKSKTMIWIMINCVLGSIIYRLFIAAALNSDFLGLEAYDLNLVTSFIVAVAMIVPNLTNRFKGNK